MKKLLFIAILGLCATFRINAQDLKDKDVPQTIRTTFEKQFNNAMLVNWKMKDGNYKAMFTQDMKKHFAEFNSQGELLAKGEKIDQDALPTKVSDAVKNGYASSKIDELYRVEKNGQTEYLVKLEGNPKKKVVYDSEGRVIKEK